MIQIAIVGIVFVLLVVFAVVAARNTWHWVNSVFLVLTFIVGVGAAVKTSEVYEVRTDHMVRAKAAKELAEKTTAAARLAVYGPDAVNYGPESLRGRNEELNLELAGRGRVWEHGQVDVKGNNRVFKFPAARPANEGVGAMQDILLHAFMDGPVPVGDGPDTVNYPVAYIGTVSVANETPDSVELESVFLANEAEFTKPTATWTLFEKMPSDRNDAFHRVEGLDVKDEAFDISDYRTKLMTKYMTASRFDMAADSPEYEKLIDSYVFDGLTRGQWENWIEENGATRINPRFEPPPEEVFREYKFNKKSGEYQVDADGSLQNDGLFTPLGHAVRIDLHSGGTGTVSFEKGQTVLVDLLNADGYQRSDGTVVEPFDQREDVTPGNESYVRQKRDYPYLLSDLKQQTARFDEETKQMKNNNQLKEQVNLDTEAQITERVNVIAGLEKDKGNLENDLNVVEGARQKSQLAWDAMQKRIATLEKQVAEQHAQLQKSGKVTNTSTKK